MKKKNTKSLTPSRSNSETCFYMTVIISLGLILYTVVQLYTTHMRFSLEANGVAADDKECDCELKVGLQSLDKPNRNLEEKARATVSGIRAIDMDEVLYEKYTSDKAIWDLFDPIVDCTTLDFTGSRSRGGQYMCNVKSITSGKNPCRVYSFGIFGGMGFERAMAEQHGCHVFVFEPERVLIDKWIGDKKQNMSVYQMTIGPLWEPIYAARDSLPTYKELHEIVADLGHKYVDILKFDVEANEYSTFPVFLRDSTFKGLGVSIILVELHYIEGWGVAMGDVTDFFIQMFEAGYYIYSKDPNIECGTYCMRYGFIRKDLVSK